MRTEPTGKRRCGTYIHTRWTVLRQGHFRGPPAQTTASESRRSTCIQRIIVIQTDQKETARGDSKIDPRAVVIRYSPLGVRCGKLSITQLGLLLRNYWLIYCVIGTLRETTAKLWLMRARLDAAAKIWAPSDRYSHVLTCSLLEDAFEYSVVMKQSTVTVGL